VIRSTEYEYPAHLREVIQDLPTTPGVYTFHGAEGDLPLYIGKSINIRNRVLSHLRTQDEARMLCQTQRISYIRCAGEIGALLLEASMIKQQQPVFNQKLRRTKQMCALILQDGRPSVVYSKNINFATQTGLYGLFASRHSALEKIRDLADEHRLCLGLLGLEKNQSGKPCFRSMINRCAGACCDKESADDHQHRLMAALKSMQIICWPYAGAIGLIEHQPDMTQIHVVQNWCYLGSATDLEQARQLSAQASGFDADGYKILCRPLLSDDTEIVEF
jgi:excinuclease Cho